MASIPSLSTPERETGVALGDWLRGQTADHRSGRGQQFNAKVIWMPSKDKPLAVPVSRGTMSVQTELLEQEESITDPNAQNRVLESHFVSMARNFAQLALVAKAVIPDLRDMTASERANLRQYSRKLYRKV